jgi:alcohol dehydrogenase
LLVITSERLKKIFKEEISMYQTYSFFMPNVNIMGKGCLSSIGEEIKSRGLRKALVVTDQAIVQTGLIMQLLNVLEKEQIPYVLFDGTLPNPTDKNVEDGLKVLQENNADFLISFGGGSPHDCAKAIGLVAVNGGSIHDYEGVNKSLKPMLPLIAVNTTSGTASEMTRFCVITDTKRKIKMAIVNWHVTPIISVDDPLLMVSMPKGLTAATGMDALTHAVEAYVSTMATPITDACAIKAIELIATYLERAVTDGSDLEAREMMTYAEFLAGMAFNNASLGYVHAMAHQLGGFYDLPHGVCNAVLLPYVCEYNVTAVPDRFIAIAKAMGVNVKGMPENEAAAKAIEAIINLSARIGIPSGLKALGAKEEDIRVLSENALQDACGLTNPKQATLEDIMNIYKKSFNPMPSVLS